MSKKKRHIRLRKIAKARGFRCVPKIVTEEIFYHCFKYPYVPTWTEEEFWNYDEPENYSCPTCGYGFGDESLIAVSPEVFSYGAAMEWGGNPVNWDELHECSNCPGKKWAFSNSNY